MASSLVKWLIRLAVILAGWLVALRLVRFAPFFGIVLFGLYCIAVVLMRVWTFPTSEGATESLEKDVIEAQEDLRARGFPLD